MKTGTPVESYLAQFFLELKMFQTKLYRKKNQKTKKKHILRSVFFF